MRNSVRLVCKAACIVGLLTAGVSAEVATFSLEVAAINSTSLAGGPVGRVVVNPGDVLTVEILVRDWSPDQKERLAAFQTQMDPQTYASGSSGYVKPPNFEPEQTSQRDNLENCFIDVDEPRFIHAGIQSIPLTDSVSSGYRWTSILLRPQLGPISPQDGTRFYCGTLNLEVSDDAEGIFAIGFIEGTNNTGLRNQRGLAITPVICEPLIVVVPRIDWRSSAVVETMIGGLNGSPDPTPGKETDIDASGEVDLTDLAWLIDLVNLPPPSPEKAAEEAEGEGVEAYVTEGENAGE